MRHARFWLAGSFLAFWLLTGCGRPQLVQKTTYVFGTEVELTVAGRSEAEALPAINAVFAEFDRMHRLLHAWQPSALTELNQALVEGRPHTPPAEVLAVIEDAAALAKAGDYLFDPGIGKLIALWGFQSDQFAAQLPPPEAIERWQKQPASIGDLEIHDGQVRSRNRDLALDLGGYGKGLALDRAADILRRSEINNALINIGGNVMALGNKNGVAWRVGIRHPRSSGFLASLELKDGEAIGTSGDYQRYFELGGRRYSHLLDPKSARPAQGTQAVTVLISPGKSSFSAKVGVRSDALSKPLFIAGRTHWADLAKRLEVTQALRVDEDASVEITEALTERIKWVDPKPIIHLIKTDARR